MADDNKITGNDVTSSDFLKVLLALKDNTLKDTHCLELAIVKEIDTDKVLCKLVSNPSLMVQAIRINNMKLNIDQIVLIGFNDTDFKSNLDKYLSNDLTLQEPSTKNKHVLTNGIIITNFTEGGSDFSGSYNDLTNKPILNTTNETSLPLSPNENIQGTINLHKIAKTGSYEDLLDKPVIPEADSDLVNNRYVRYDVNNQNLDAAQKQNARTNIDAYSKPSGGIPDSDLAEDYIKQGDTLTKPLTVAGGDSTTAGKIILDQTNNGQITDLTTRTLLGFLNAVDLTVGNATYNLKLRGLQARPTYNGNNLALLSDIPTDTDTWRNILINDTEILGTGIDTGALNLKQGSNVTITNNNGDVTIEATDIGATRLSGATFTGVLVNDYVNFTTTDEYVNLYIYISGALTKVTAANKDSLSIVPGTTQAYFYSNGYSGGFFNEYYQATRTISLLNNAKFITGNDVENQLNINSILPIQNKVLAKLIPAQASSSNQLADKDFVNSSINALAAFFITKDAQGDNFNTYAELINATTFYSGGSQRIPTTNDYTYVRWDENKGEIVSGYTSFTTTDQYIGHFVIYNNEGVEVTLTNKDSVGITPGTTIAYDNLPTTRYSYQGGTYPVGQWDFQLIVNNSALTAKQIAALNSGITAALVVQIVQNQNNITTLQQNSLTNVSYDSSTKKLQQTKNGTTSDIVQFGDNAFNSDPIPGYKGMYSSTTQYHIGDIVKYSSNINPMLYICIQNTLGNAPSGPAVWNNSYWQALSYDAARCWIETGINSQKKYLWGSTVRGSNYEIANSSSDKIYMQDDYLFSNDEKVINESDLFPAFSSSLTYAIGDIVIYNHQYYKCTTAIATPGAWNSTNWTQTSIIDMFDSKQDTLVSGVNIKTINGNSILGSGNISISGVGTPLYLHKLVYNSPNGYINDSSATLYGTLSIYIVSTLSTPMANVSIYTLLDSINSFTSPSSVGQYGIISYQVEFDSDTDDFLGYIFNDAIGLEFIIDKEFSRYDFQAAYVANVTATSESIYEI